MSSSGPVAVNGGIVVVQGQQPLVYGGDPQFMDDGTPITRFTQSIQAIANVAAVNVIVVDEFYE